MKIKKENLQLIRSWPLDHACGKAKWNNLPYEILNLIFEHVNIAESKIPFVTLRAVCSSWRSVAVG